MIAGLKKNQFVTLSIVLVLFLCTVVCLSANCQRVEARSQKTALVNNLDSAQRQALVANAAVRPLYQQAVLTQPKIHEIAQASFVPEAENDLSAESVEFVEESIQAEPEEIYYEEPEIWVEEEPVYEETYEEYTEPEYVEEPVYVEPEVYVEEYTEPVQEYYEEPVVYEEPVSYYEEPAYVEPAAAYYEEPAPAEVYYEEPAVSYEPQLTYLGNFMMTAYCPCSACCGAYATGYTASGTYATEGVTVAMGDLPFGTRIMINGHIYTVEDRGTAYGHVDIFFSNHASALAFGLQYADVYLVE